MKNASFETSGYLARARARARTALVNVGPPALTHKGRAFKALPGDFLLNFVHFQRADFHSLCIDFVFKMIILKENYRFSLIHHVQPP